MNMATLSTEAVLNSGLTCVSIDSETGTHVEIALNRQAGCQALERGKILFFPQSPIQISELDLALLRAQRSLESHHHKNIAYRPLENKLTGMPHNPDVQRILKAYSEQVTAFLTKNFACYAGFRLDYASYRPVEEAGRSLRLRARNDLMHVDSFPTRPTYGDRILRFFTNVNPQKSRVWQTSHTFEWLAPVFRHQLPALNNIHQTARPKNAFWPQLFKQFGLKQSYLSVYDHWMSALHDTLKADENFQRTCVKNTIAFPPGSAWMVLTDMVSHSVISGQYALEQTVIVPVSKMTQPEKAPLHILSAMARR